MHHCLMKLKKHFWRQTVRMHLEIWMIWEKLLESSLTTEFLEDLNWHKNFMSQSQITQHAHNLRKKQVLKLKEECSNFSYKNRRYIKIFHLSRQTKPLEPTEENKTFDFTGPKEGFLRQFEGEWAPLLFEL